MKKKYEIEDKKPNSSLAEYQEEFLTDRKNEVEKFLKSSTISLDEVRKTAHKWKGFSDPYGFQILALYAIDLEQAALASKSKECLMMLKEIDMYLSEKEAKLNEK